MELIGATWCLASAADRWGQDFAQQGGIVEFGIFAQAEPLNDGLGYGGRGDDFDFAFNGRCVCLEIGENAFNMDDFLVAFVDLNGRGGRIVIWQA